MIGTWQRLIAAVRARWPVAQEPGDSITIGTASRSLRIDRLEVAAFPESSFIAIRFVLCRRDQMPPSSALRANSELALGTVALRGDVYELRHVLDLSSICVDQLERRLGFLAKLVGALRRAHMRLAAADGEAYAMFAE